MPIAYVLLTDTLDQWRIKTNQMIDTVNTLTGAGSILSVSSPSAGQVLVCDGTVFKNVTAHGDVTIDPDGTTHLDPNSQALSSMMTKGRVRFAGSMSLLY